jgi:hypothetical protein
MILCFIQTYLFPCGSTTLEYKLIQGRDYVIFIFEFPAPSTLLDYDGYLIDIYEKQENGHEERIGGKI